MVINNNNNNKKLKTGVAVVVQSIEIIVNLMRNRTTNQPSQREPDFAHNMQMRSLQMHAAHLSCLCVCCNNWKKTERLWSTCSKVSVSDSAHFMQYHILFIFETQLNLWMHVANAHLDIQFDLFN